MEDLDCSALAYIQNSVPLLRVLLAQFVNPRAYGANRFSVRWSLPELQLVKSISEILPHASRKPAQCPNRITLKSERNKPAVIVSASVSDILLLVYTFLVCLVIVPSVIGRNRFDLTT